MADIILLTVPIPAEGQATPTSVKLYQSATLLGARSLVDTATLASLGYTSDPPEELTWEVATADPAAYSWLVFVAAGIEGQPALLPPSSADVDECTLYVSTKDMTGVAEADVKLTAKLAGSRIVLGGALIGRGAKEFLTDANGYVSFVVARGASVSIDFPPLGSPKTIDTTGRAGIDIALEP